MQTTSFVQVWESELISLAHEASSIMRKVCARSGDDGIAIHGRFSTVVKVIREEGALILGAPILNPGELNSGDTIVIYTPDGRRLGSTSELSLHHFLFLFGNCPTTANFSMSW